MSDDAPKAGTELTEKFQEIQRMIKQAPNTQEAMRLPPEMIRLVTEIMKEDIRLVTERMKEDTRAIKEDTRAIKAAIRDKSEEARKLTRTLGRIERRFEENPHIMWARSFRQERSWSEADDWERFVKSHGGLSLGIKIGR